MENGAKLFRYGGITLLGGKSSPNDVDAYLCFHLKLRTSRLLVKTPTNNASHSKFISQKNYLIPLIRNACPP